MARAAKTEVLEEFLNNSFVLITKEISEVKLSSAGLYEKFRVWRLSAKMRVAEGSRLATAAAIVSFNRFGATGSR